MGAVSSQGEGAHVIEQIMNMSGYGFRLSAIPPLVTAVAVLMAGLATLVHERASRAGVQFLVLAFAVALWQASYGMMYLTLNHATALWWARIAHVGIIFIPILVFHFTVIVLGEAHVARYNILTGYFLTILVIALALAHQDFVAGLNLYDWGYYTSYGSLGGLMFLLYIYYCTLAFVRVRRAALEKGRPPAVRKRIRGFFGAYLVGLMAIVDIPAAYGFAIYPYGFMPLLIFYLLTASLTWRYSLFDITPAIAAQQIVDTVADAIIVVDPEGMVRVANPAAESLFGSVATEIQGKSLAEAVHSQDFALRIMAALEYAEEGGALEFNYVSSEYGERTLSFSASRVLDEEGQLLAYACIFHDVTEQRRAHDELERRVYERTTELSLARDRALEASRTKSAFLANMSHELRTPLNAIIGYAEILEEELENTIDQANMKDIGRIRRAGRDLAVLVNNILDLSKIEAGRMELHMEEIDIAALVEETAEVYGPLVTKRGNRLHIEGAESGRYAYADKLKVRQCLLNLLSNANKFTHGGDITIRLGQDGRFRLDVIDTGIGIAPDKLPYLFDDFIQAHDERMRSYGGTGLGLAISRRFCVLMGGDLVVESEMEVGSVFSMILPLTKVQNASLEIGAAAE